MSDPDHNPTPPDENEGFLPLAVDLRDYVVFDLDAPAGRRVLSTDVLALDVICLEPQQTLDARTFATADAVYTVLAGTAWVVTDEVEVTLSALQAVMIPAGEPHGLRNSSADPLILQVITSPPEEVGVVPLGPAPAAVAEHDATTARPSLLDRLRRTLGSG
ncbi:MAG: cupin domain-containing protein [Euzebya sp.]